MLKHNNVEVIKHLSSIESKSIVKRGHVVNEYGETYCLMFENDRYLGEVVYWSRGIISFQSVEVETGVWKHVDPYDVIGDNYIAEIKRYISENGF